MNMNLFAKTNGSVLVALMLSSKNDINGWNKLSTANSFNPSTGKITVSGTAIPYDEVMKYSHNFVYSTGNIISFKSGINSGNYNAKLEAINADVPLAFTRANTVVNFGRL